MSERWSYLDEISDVLVDSKRVSNVGGPILAQAYGRNLIYGGDGHSIILGASGTGKTSCMTLALVRDLARAKESMIVADPKGDLYRAVDCYLNGYQKIVFDFRNLYRSARWNPLNLIAYMLKSNDPELVSFGMQKLEDLAIALFPHENDKDPFWANSSRDVFIAMAQLLIKHAKPDEVTIASIFKAIIDGDNRHGMGKRLLQSFLDELEDGSSLAADQLHSYINTANDTRAGIRSTFQQCLSPFVRSDALLTFLSNEDSVKIYELEDRPTAIFVILDDQSSAFDKIASVLLGQLTQHYISLANSRPQGRLKVRMNCVFEELGNIGSSLCDLDKMMSAARSRNVRLHLVLQAYSQLDNLYGSSKATTIRDNVKVVVAFSVNNLQTMQELSAVCGEKEDPETGRMQPLITPSRLRALRVGEALIMVEGHIKYVKKLPFYQQAFDCSDWKEPEVREPKYLKNHAVFDIKRLVEEKENERVEKALKEMKSKPVNQTPFWDVPGEHIEKEPVDLDDLIQRIDKRIAELEEEEKQKAEEDKKQKVEEKADSKAGKNFGKNERVIHEVRIEQLGTHFNDALKILVEHGVPGPIAQFRLSKDKPRIPCHTVSRAIRIVEELKKIGVLAVIERKAEPVD